MGEVGWESSMEGEIEPAYSIRCHPVHSFNLVAGLPSVSA